MIVVDRIESGYDLAMFERKTLAIVLLGLMGVGVFSACKQEPTVPVPTPSERSVDITIEPALAETIQADADLTAEWVATFQVNPTATDEPLPTLLVIQAEGTPPSDRRGECPVPEGYVEHYRQGFCLSAPEDWTIQNVDGGLAAFLGTTPGQAIGLYPDWAEDPTICQLTIYITLESSAEEHIQDRYVEFGRRTDLEMLSPIAVKALGEMATPGFEWRVASGRAGGVYAGMIDGTHLVHMSYSGSACILDSIVPVFNTIRFQ